MCLECFEKTSYRCRRVIGEGDESEARLAVNCEEGFTERQPKDPPHKTNKSHYVNDPQFEVYLPRSARMLLSGSCHEPDHSYRVCDNLRFPVFPPLEGGGWEHKRERGSGKIWST